MENELNTKKLWLNFTNINTFDKEPFIVAQGYGAYVKDIEGNEYLDAISGIWNAGLGYSRKDITRNISEQIDNLPFTSLFGRAYPLLIKYTENLLMCAPEYSRVFYGTGGSDSVETALKVVQSYFYKMGKIKKKKIGHFSMSYHGVSMGALNVMGEIPNREGYDLDTENYFTLSLPQDEGDNVFNEIVEVNPEEVSAIIIEPIIGSGGIISFDFEFLKRLREFTVEHDILLIFDEVVTGFGRTGALFAYQDADIVPDILVLAKNITAGYAPLGATLFTEKIVRVFKDDQKFLHGYTNAGSVVGIAAAQKVLDIFQTENIIENVRRQSSRIFEKLQILMEKFPTLIKEVRGRGLMIGVQLVEKDGEELDYFYQLMADEKILSRSAYDNVVVLMPPLISDDLFVDSLLNKFEQCVTKYAVKYEK